MPPREWRVRILDIIGAAERALRHTDGMDCDAFLKDEKAVDAVARCFDVIGEAARGVPDDVVDAHPQLPWAEMRGMRNVLVHEYFNVTTETLWRTAREDLPPVITALRRLLAEP